MTPLKPIIASAVPPTTPPTIPTQVVVLAFVEDDRDRDHNHDDDDDGGNGG